MRLYTPTLAGPTPDGCRAPDSARLGYKLLSQYHTTLPGTHRLLADRVHRRVGIFDWQVVHTATWQSGRCFSGLLQESRYYFRNIPNEQPSQHYTTLPGTHRLPSVRALAGCSFCDLADCSLMRFSFPTPPGCFYSTSPPSPLLILERNVSSFFFTSGSVRSIVFCSS